jgi:hypothetical protein
MKILEVTTPKLAREFLLLPVKLYKDEPHWIRPLNSDVESVFDRKRNKMFLNGECTRWILQENEKTIGRVAAFIDKKSVNKGNDQPTGGMGFFECIENQEAAFMLMDQCKKWLEERGMKAMDGPINFGQRDKWWGLLVEGFDRDVNYQCNYNFPYYQKYFESYGFQAYFNQYTYGRKVLGPVSERLTYKAELVAKDPNYRFDYPRNIDLEKLAYEIRTIYNKAWAKRGEIPELTEIQAKHLLKQMKHVMDKHLLWFGYYKDEPISFFISIPEVNQIMKHVNGNLNWFGKLKFLWHTFRKTNKKAFGILFGIVPQHHGKGVDGAMIIGMKKLVQENYLRYEDYEFGWIGDFNPKMMKVADQIDASIVKRHITYRKLFNPAQPFKRMPIVN